MRAYIKREQNVLEVPEGFATLVKIDPNLSEGSYHYKFEYLVNPEKAFRNNAILVEMFVSKEPWSVRTYNIFNKFDPEEAIINIRLKNQKQKDFYRSSDLIKDNKVWIPYITSDITRFISNTEVAKFSRGKRITEGDVFKPVVSTRTLVKPILVSELTSRNTEMPILEVNTSKRRNEFGIDGSSVDSNELRRRASSVLFQKKIDPASFVGKRSNTITSAKHSYSGVIPKKNGSGDVHNDDDVLITSLLKNNQSNSDADKNQTDYQSIPVVETNTNIVVEETMSIPISYLDSDEFYVVFRLKNKRGMIIETVSGLVSHGKQVSLLRIPSIPPVIVTPPKSAFGGTTINLKQADPNGTSIKLYRKHFSTIESLKDSTYSLVGEVKCGINDGFVKIFDYPNSLDPVIYRAVSVNSSGLVGSEFSSSVVETIRGSVAKTSPKNQKPNFVTISTTVLPGGITVKLSNFPSGPIAFELKRRDLTMRESAYTSVNAPALLDVLQSSEISIEDTTGLQSKHIYEYAVFLIYKTGEVKQSATRHIVNFKTSVSNIVSLDISPANIEQSGGNEIDVKFSITKNISQNSADQIKSFLTKQGFLGEFQEDIIANRDKLGNLFAIGVTRHNLSTGQVEDFGILESDDFSDIAAGSTSGVSSLVAGNEYRYVVTAYSRNIESLLPNLVKTDSTNQNLPYTFTPAEWTHPITLEDGNIITEESLKRNYASKSFTFGAIADVKEFQVSLSEVLPALYDGKAKFLPGRKSTLVQWKVQGNVNKIDHFIVVLDILGMKTIVGKTHNVSNSNYFQFLDNLDNQESGGLTYFIVPVYFDYSRGVELKTNQVVV